MELSKHKRVWNFILIAGILLCCLYAFHDMQTAEGVGLLLAMKLGVEQRLPVDVFVDVVCIAVLALLVYLPCKLLKHNSQAAYVRLLIGYLAAVPGLSPAKVIALFRPEERVYLWDMGFLPALEGWVYSILPFFRIWIPLFIILFGVAGVTKSFAPAKWHKTVVVLLVALGLVLLLAPSAENPVVYLMGYLGLLIAFDCWEALLAAHLQWDKWYNGLFILLLLKGVYQMIVLVSLV